ncbi:hypothetical protein MTO96_051412 [Rhipicephalus appendiculatus]
MKPWRIRDLASQEVKSGKKGNTTEQRNSASRGGADPWPDAISTRRMRVTPTDDSTEAEESRTKSAKLSFRLQRAKTKLKAGVQYAGIPIGSLSTTHETPSVLKERRKSASAVSGATAARRTTATTAARRRHRKGSHSHSNEDGAFKSRGRSRHTPSSCREAPKLKSSNSQNEIHFVSSPTSTVAGTTTVTITRRRCCNTGMTIRPRVAVMVARGDEDRGTRL